MHTASTTSVIWGGGSIRAGALPSLDVRKIHALRGKLTKKLVEESCDVALDLPLGDPAVLMPSMYNPKGIEKTYKIGLIPHFIDRPIIENWGIELKSDDLIIIDVSLDQ